EDLITEKSSTLKLLQMQVDNLKNEINDLVEKSQVLRAEMVEQAAELPRFVPAAATRANTQPSSPAQQRDTLFARQTQQKLTETLSAERVSTVINKVAMQMIDNQQPPELSIPTLPLVGLVK
ncbi:MAG: hypothetical protein ACK4PR_03735, partial [Gammaproteobacteria bacterium]